MPLYEFVCGECQSEQELLVRAEERPVCENCGSSHLTKLLSAPAAHTMNSGGNPGRNMPPGNCGSGCGCFPG